MYKNNKDTIIATLLSNLTEIKELNEKNEKLEYMAPIEGGPEYQKAKNNFEKNANNFKNYGTQKI